MFEIDSLGVTSGDVDLKFGINIGFISVKIDLCGVPPSNLS
ncbi:MAG: hypothetical protein OXF77_00045 [Thaumarchaeota archaeon]|nr:hypothetical protein [Nitrososphaerota archaeon]